MERQPRQLANSSVGPQHVREPRMSDTRKNSAGRKADTCQGPRQRTFDTCRERKTQRPIILHAKVCRKVTSQTPWTTGKQVDEASSERSQSPKTGGTTIENAVHLILSVGNTLIFGLDGEIVQVCNLSIVNENDVVARRLLFTRVQDRSNRRTQQFDKRRS